MHTAPRTIPRVELRADAFATAAAARGLTTIAAQAQAAGVRRSTLSRILDKSTVPGERFIAGALAAFPHRCFEDFFVVVTEDTAEQDGAGQ